MVILVGNIYSAGQLMHTFLENFQQVGRYSAHIKRRQSEFRRKEKCVDQKSLSISALKNDFLNLENSVRNTERASFDQPMCSHCGLSHPTRKLFKQQRKDKYHKK